MDVIKNHVLQTFMPPWPGLLGRGTVSPFRGNTAKGEWVRRRVSIQTVVKIKNKTFH